MSWGTWTRTTTARHQKPADFRYLIPHGAATRCLPPLAVLTRDARSMDPAAQCPRRDSNSHCPAPHAGASYPLGYEDIDRGTQEVTPATASTTCVPLEPPPGDDPGHPPYEGGAATVRGGVESWCAATPKGMWGNHQARTLPGRMGRTSHPAYFGLHTATARPCGPLLRGWLLLSQPSSFRYRGWTRTSVAEIQSLSWMPATTRYW
jgi:hypothetical protein